MNLTVSQICETIMLICFGLSWPFSVVKSFKSKTAKGKSIFFQLAITTGYIAGIVGKAYLDNFTYIFWLYVLNLFMVSLDLVLYFRNVELDKKNEFECKCMILDIESKEKNEPMEKTTNEDEYEAGLVLATVALESHRGSQIMDEKEEKNGFALANAALGVNTQ